VSLVHSSSLPPKHLRTHYPTTPPVCPQQTVVVCLWFTLTPPSPQHHLCLPYPWITMALFKPAISPTLHDHPLPWKVAINRAARSAFAEWDTFGFLFGVCDDVVWAVLHTSLGGHLRDRSDFPVSAALGANVPLAAHDAFKCATNFKQLSSLVRSLFVVSRS
jgi:hypothetical protein